MLALDKIREFPGENGLSSQLAEEAGRNMVQMS